MVAEYQRTTHGNFGFFPPSNCTAQKVSFETVNSQAMLCGMGEGWIWCLKNVNSLKGPAQVLEEA